MEEKAESATCLLFVMRLRDEIRNKQWLEWMKLRDTDLLRRYKGGSVVEEKTIWEDTKSGKSNKVFWKECELFASRIIRASLDAHRGEKDLKVELGKYCA